MEPALDGAKELHGKGSRSTRCSTSTELPTLKRKWNQLNKLMALHQATRNMPSNSRESRVIYRTLDCLTDRMVDSSLSCNADIAILK